jgi:peptidoglycan glycosyltransferase
MNAPLRRAGVVVMVLFALLFINLNWVQAYKADDYRTDEHNGRVQTSQYARQRGSISIGSGGKVVLAQSRETGDELKYLRTYPGGPEYAHIVGYDTVNLADAGIEKLEDDYLSGEAGALFTDRLVSMFSDTRKPGGNVVLSLSGKAQDAAFGQLSDNKVNAAKGSVVAIDPKTGAILAAASIPSYDPNPLADHDTKKASDAQNALEQNPNKPLANRAFSETYPPGSTFKVVVASAALENGLTPQSQLTGGTEYTAPQTTLAIRNAPGVVCPEQLTLNQALTVSCNTAFSRLGVEQLGMEKVKAAAQKFGFEEIPKIDQDDKNIFNVAPSRTGDMTGPDGKVDPPALAQSCIGQKNVRMTALQGAQIAATVANGGNQMRPYLVHQLLNSDLRATFTAVPKVQREVLSAQVASDLRGMMISVVANGTGRNAQISGVQVGGKTGTAQNGDNPDHGWFIGFAMKNNEPIVAVAVFLEQAGSGGSGEATRIGGTVMKAVIDERGLK